MIRRSKVTFSGQCPHYWSGPGASSFRSRHRQSHHPRLASLLDSDVAYRGTYVRPQGGKQHCVKFPWYVFHVEVREQQELAGSIS